MKWSGVLFSIVLCYCSNEATTASAISAQVLVRPCLDDLVGNLIGQEDADGHILYEARESFELTPKRFKAMVAKVQHQLRDLHQRTRSQSHS